MAKYTNVDKYFNDKQRGIEKGAKAVTEQMTLDLGESIQTATADIEGVSVSTKKEKVNVTYEKPAHKTDDIVDLKKYFKRSSKRKDTIDGGWYMVVPIRRYTGRAKETRESAKGMSSRLYTDLLNKPASTGYANLMSRYLYDNRGPGSAVRDLNYVPKSQGITRMPNPKGAGHTYVSFRTVSDKSHPASWLLNRDTADPANPSAEVERIVKEVAKFNFG